MEPRGSVAEQIDGLWWILLVLGAAVFVVFAGLLVAALLRRGDDRSVASSPRPWLVGGGVVLPAVVVTIVLFATIAALADQQRGDESGLVIEVTSHQWWWEVEYPDLGVTTANEIHIPAGEPVTLRLRSADVVHSLWVPALAGKLDLLPERTNELVLDADAPGRYPGRCAEFCGLQHARMELTVVAHEPSDFDSWVAAQAAPAEVGDAHRSGQDLFDGAGCATCHTIRGTDATGDDGPALTHLASRERIGAGTLPNDADALARWVTDPHDAKSGVKMPATPLEPDEVEAIVSFLQELE